MPKAQDPRAVELKGLIRKEITKISDIAMLEAINSNIQRLLKGDLKAVEEEFCCEVCPCECSKDPCECPDCPHVIEWLKKLDDPIVLAPAPAKLCQSQQASA